MLPKWLPCALAVQQALGFPGKSTGEHLPSRIGRDSRKGLYQIPNAVQDAPSKARFDIPTPGNRLETHSLWSLDAPQVNPINSSVFDWWYFDAVSETNPNDSLVITFFASSFAAFPYLRKNETSILTVWLWASFANGTVFGDYVPATVATVTGGERGAYSSGEWSETGFSWNASAENLSRYEVVIASEKMQVQGKLILTAVSYCPTTGTCRLLILSESEHHIIYRVACKREEAHWRYRLILDG